LEISIGTLTLKLDRATHLQGLEFQKDYSKLSASEVEMLYLDKDTRFQEIFSLLTDAETVRSKDIYNNGRYFLLPLPDSAPRKSSLIGMLGMVVHVGRKDKIEANERDTWLELLGDVIMEWECNQTPVMADVRAWMIMKALKANNITSEGEMHDTLRAHRSEEERVAFIRDQLGLSGLLMQNMVLSYFSRVWAHFEASGKGAHFTFPLSEGRTEVDEFEGDTAVPSGSANASASLPVTEQARAGVAAFVAQARGSAAALLRPRASKGPQKSDTKGEQSQSQPPQPGPEPVEELALDFIPPPAP
jgi:hypothetical protein